MTEGAIGYEYPDVLTGFQQGKAATAFQWNAAAPTSSMRASPRDRR